MARQRQQRNTQQVQHSRARKIHSSASRARSNWSPAIAVCLCLCGLAAAYTFNVPLAAALSSVEVPERKESELVELAGQVDLKAKPKQRRPAKPAAKYKVLKVYDHDVKAFTQGLAWYNGSLYESTGMYRQSEVRKVNLETGKVTHRSRTLPPKLFGEGMTILNDTVHQITWQGKQGFTYNVTSLEPVSSFRYNTSTGEGWGITHNDTHLIVSDGSSTLHFWDPETHKELDTLQVTRQGVPVNRINELEYFNGSVWANVWFSDEIMRIDPSNGTVVDVINFAAIYPKKMRQKELTSMDAVLNGIAWNEDEGVLYLTGKLWPRLYKIKLLIDDTDDSNKDDQD